MGAKRPTPLPEGYENLDPDRPTSPPPPPKKKWPTPDETIVYLQYEAKVQEKIIKNLKSLIEKSMDEVIYLRGYFESSQKYNDEDLHKIAKLENKSACPCNCHDPEYRKVTGSDEHENCSFCAKELVEEAMELERIEHELTAKFDKKTEDRLALLETVADEASNVDGYDDLQNALYNLDKLKEKE